MADIHIVQMHSYGIQTGVGHVRAMVVIAAAEHAQSLLLRAVTANELKVWPLQCSCKLIQFKDLQYFFKAGFHPGQLKLSETGVAW
jgi:hypothetical protein